MEGRLDYVNRSFHDARGLLPSEVFEGLPTGIVPSITVPRGRFEEKEGSPLLQARGEPVHGDEQPGTEWRLCGGVRRSGAGEPRTGDPHSGESDEAW